MSGAEWALGGTFVSSFFSLAALIVSRIRCRTVRDDDGSSYCLSACSDKPLVSEELTVDEYKIGEQEVLILRARK